MEAEADTRGIAPAVEEGRILSARIQKRTARLNTPSRNGFDEFEIVFTCEAREVQHG